MNIRLSIIIALVLSVQAEVISQLSDTVIYSTSFYFEDSQGHKDTVFYTGLVEGFNPSVFEADLSSQPFDDVFEVRILRDYSLEITPQVNSSYKNIYTNWDLPFNGNSLCEGPGFGGEAFYFAIKARNWPIKISWEEELFESGGAWECWPGSALINNVFPFVNDAWWYDTLVGVSQFACMETVNEKVFYPVDESTDLIGFSVMYIAVEGQEHLSDTVSLFSFYPFSSSTPYCDGTTNNNEKTIIEQIGINLYPNPVADNLFLEINSDILLSNDIEVNIFDLCGRGIYSKKLRPIANSDVQFDLAFLAKGTYVISIQSANQRPKVLKFTKM